MMSADRRLHLAEAKQLTVVRHSQDGNLSNGPSPTLYSTSTLVQCRQIGVQVSRVTASTRNFFTSRRDLSKRIRIPDPVS